MLVTVSDDPVSEEVPPPVLPSSGTVVDAVLVTVSDDPPPDEEVPPPVLPSAALLVPLPAVRSFSPPAPKSAADDVPEAYRK